MEFILFLFGLVLLIKGADFLVDGASAIAKKYNISDIVIGLTIVSFGTSLPELVVNLIASSNNNPGLAIGNVFGSNIANVLLILGIAAVIRPLPITRNTYLIEIPFSLTAALLVGFLANAALFSEHAKDFMKLSHFDGVVLLFFFLLFIGYIYTTAVRREISDHAEQGEGEASTEKALPMWRSVLYIVVGLVGLYFGGQWVVDSAVTIASALGMSDSFIGLTVVAVGTSLPELVTSAVAAYKNKVDIAVGNVVGSNIFNLLWILGFSAILFPLPFQEFNNTDVLMIILSSTMLILAVAIGRRAEINRFEGSLFILGYIAYITYLVGRG